MNQKRVNEFVLDEGWNNLISLLPQLTDNARDVNVLKEGKFYRRLFLKLA